MEKKTAKAIIDGQLASVEILKKRQLLWWEQVLVSYKSNWRNEDGAITYTTKEVKWINEDKLIYHD